MRLGQPAWGGPARADRMRWCKAAGIAGAAALSAALGAAEAPVLDPATLLGGDATVMDIGPQAYLRPIASLTADQTKRFKTGHYLFDTRWVIFWFEQGEWGAGPTFNARGCGDCHVRNGRGAPVAGGADAHPMVLRLSLPGTNEHGGPLPDPHYGDQLQTQGVERVVPEEGSVEVRWVESTATFADGETVTLRKPEVSIRQLNFGPFGDGVMISARTPPALVGAGLIDAIPEDEILALAARTPVDGIRGRPNRVWDFAQKRLAVGRFGHKATHSTLRQQIAAAFSADIGVSSDYFPEQNCPGPQRACQDLMPAGRPELGHVRWDAVETHLRSTAVPARRDVGDAVVKRGEQLFAEARCAVCHVPELKTGEVPGYASLSRQTIRPYTDLLLHDLGEGLADNRPDFMASGSEWRTPPLWGIGLTRAVNGVTTYLHDGRARTLTEAILWHGGEATVAREAFRAMPKDDRAALVRFLESL